MKFSDFAPMQRRKANSRHLVIMVCCMVAAALLASCKSSFTSPYGIRALRVDEPIFPIKAVRLKDSTLRLSFITSPRLRTTDPGIRWVEAAIGPDERSLNDTITFALSYTNTPGSETTVTLVGDAPWDTPSARRSASAVADISVVTSTDHLIFRLPLAYQEAQPMDLTPFVVSRGDSALEIGVQAKRIFLLSDEYLPTSENFRVIISDEKGTVVWRSDAGMNFMQAITSVEPQTPNHIQRYAVVWNGQHTMGETVPPGTYKAELIIPARPRAYMNTVEFAWPPK